MKGLLSVALLRSSGPLDRTASNVFCSLLTLLFLATTSALVLHLHLEDDHLHITGSGHAAECALCDLGFSSDPTVALPSGKIELLVFTGLVLSFTYLATHTLASRLSFSSRAPPEMNQ